MTIDPAPRPTFYQGQYLGPEDLAIPDRPFTFGTEEIPRGDRGNRQHNGHHDASFAAPHASSDNASEAGGYCRNRRTEPTVFERVH